MAERSEKNPSNGAHKKSSRKKLIGGKIIAWAGSLAGTAVVTFVAAYFTVLGTNIAPTPSSSGQPTESSLRTGSPVQVTVGNVVGIDKSRALPDPVNLSIKQLGYLNSINGSPSSAYQNWFTKQGFAFVGEVDIQLVVQGNRHHLVRIVNITPVEHCSAPLGGTMFYSPNQGEDTGTHLYLNLDNPQLPSSYTLNSPVKHPDYFKNYSISLGYGDQYTFEVATSAKKRYCMFWLNLTIIDGDKTLTESVGDKGRPFSVTPFPSPKKDNPARFSVYQDLYLGAGTGAAGSYNQNSFGAFTWVKASPKKFLG